MTMRHTPGSVDSRKHVNMLTLEYVAHLNPNLYDL